MAPGGIALTAEAERAARDTASPATEAAVIAVNARRVSFILLPDVSFRAVRASARILAI
jgi:hypothetical protein